MAASLGNHVRRHTIIEQKDFMSTPNQASLTMYRLGWAQPLEYFEARMKYFVQADKAARTFAVLSERPTETEESSRSSCSTRPP